MLSTGRMAWTQGSAMSVNTFSPPDIESRPSGYPRDVLLTRAYLFIGKEQAI